jgi:hypothetical protein
MRPWHHPGNTGSAETRFRARNPRSAASAFAVNHAPGMSIKRLISADSASELPQQTPRWDIC